MRVRASSTWGAGREESQEQIAHDAGQERGGKDPDLCPVVEGRVVEGNPGDEDGDGEPDGGQQAHAEHLRPRDSGGETADAQPHGQPCRAQYADHFANEKRDKDAQGHGARAGVGEGVGREDDAGVGEREEGQDDEAHPGVNDALDALHGALSPAAEPLDLLHSRLRLFLLAVLHFHPEFLEKGVDGDGVVFALESRLGGNDRRQCDARQGGVDAGLQQELPHDDTQDEVEAEGTHTEPDAPRDDCE